MKTILPTRTKWLLSLSPILAIVLLICCYSAFAKARRVDTQYADSAARASLASQIPNLSSRSDSDNDPDYIEARREYLSRLLGGVSPEAFASARVAVLALPLSPLLQGRKFMPVQTLTSPWRFPISPPITGEYLGPASAMIHALAINPTNHNIVYTGSYGGLAKSTNGGLDWQYLSDAWESQEVSSIAFDPIAPNHIYVGTGRDNAAHGVGLYRSSDGGATWTNLVIGGVNPFGGTIIRAVAVDPNAFGAVYVANGSSSTSGLWRSTDFGATWGLAQVGPSPCPSPCNGVYDLAIDYSANPSILYVANDNGVFKSFDSGANWRPIYASAGRLSVVNSVLYLLAGPRPDLFKSTDRGENWTPINTTYPLSVFAVDPADGRTILGGNTQYEVGLYRTGDEGGNWTEVGTSSIHPDQRVIVFSLDNSGVVYDGNDGGIVGSVDHGLTWANLNQNLPGALLQSVAIGQDDTMIAGTQDNGPLFSHQGAPWNSFLFISDVGHSSIDPTDSETSYFTLLGISKTFYKYQYHIGQYTAISPYQLSMEACHPLPPFSMNPSSPRHLIAACQSVVRTLDATATPQPDWKTIGRRLGIGGGPGNTVSATCEAPSNPNVIYAVANYWGQNVYVTSDAQDEGHAVWTDITPAVLPVGNMFTAVAVDPTNSQKAYLAATSALYRTTNMGKSWTQLTAPANAGYVDLAIDPPNPTHIFAASRLGVFASTDGGETWGNMSDGIPPGTDIRGLSFNGTSLQLAAATYGRGVYVIDLDDVAPTVSITSPIPGATVSGTVPVKAMANDNHRVAGVQFKLDGANLYAEVLAPPFSINWDTTLSPNGSHTLTAVARDPAGNTTTSAAVTVTVVN